MEPRDYTRLTQIEARGNRLWAIGKEVECLRLKVERGKSCENL